MKRRFFSSLKRRLFAMFVVVSLVPVAAVGLSFQQILVQSGANQSAVASEQLVTYVVNEIDNQLRAVSQEMDPLIIDFAFQEYIGVARENTIRQLYEMRLFRDKWANAVVSNPIIRGVLYLDRKGKAMYTSQYGEVADPLHDFREDALYGAVFRADKPMLLPAHRRAYTKSESEVISYVKPVKQFDANAIGAWLVVEIDKTALFTVLEKLDYRGAVLMELLHPSGQRFALIGEEQAAALMDGRWQLLDGSRGSLVVEADGRRYQVTYREIAVDGWKLVGITSLEEIAKGTRDAAGVTWLIGFLMLAVSTAAAIFFVNRLLGPLYRLKASMIQLGTKKRRVKVPNSSIEEIDFLIHTYNEMLEQLDNLEETVDKTLARQREKELLQLQAHINPHFFFNTLETVESFAIRNDGEKVEQIVQIIARMMRYTIRQDGGWATLREEMGQIRDLLRIHQFRTQASIRLETDIPEALLDAPLMKLSIQPFVENALKYGWRSNINNDEFTVCVRASRRDGAFLLEVVDNGSGMPEDVLAIYRQLIASRGQELHPFLQKHTGIHNVYRRFVLAYGDRFDMDIGNRPEGGTAVRIRIDSTAGAHATRKEGGA
jgi:sensor histidine kinase YesM